MQFDFIVAVDSKWGMAKDGKLPWTGTEAGKQDMSWFVEKTKKGAVIMGRKTWDAIGHPLAGRINIVVCGKSFVYSDHIEVESLEEALSYCADNKIKHNMVIGGAVLYAAAMKSPWLRYGYVTMIDGDFECDMKFPMTLGDSYHVLWYPGMNEYRLYDYSNCAELEFIGLCRRLLVAPLRQNRTGVPTRGLFHEVLKFPLRDNRGLILPLITTKFTPWRLIYHELIWFLRASTDTSYLIENNVHIWDGNTTREFLDGRQLHHYSVGDVGPIYGCQWRNWNTGTGHVDQLKEAISALKSDPWSRRLIVSAWNVGALPAMALPPCHLMYQFHVDPDCEGQPKYLNCLVIMRSADVALGVPFNIASYAFLTHIVAQIVGLLPGVLSVSMTDCHIYSTHTEGVKLLIQRDPRRFPTIKFNCAGNDIDDYAYKFGISDYKISDYVPYPALKLPMAV